MKKNIRFILFSAVLVVVLAAGLAVVLNIPESNDSGDKDTTSTDILLYDKTRLDAEEITVSRDGDEYVLAGFSYDDQISDADSSQDNSDSDTSSDESSNKRVDKYDEEVRINMHYTMQGYEEMELSKNMTDQLAYQCSYVAATMLVDKTGKKYADYGLDKPVSMVTTIFSDNSEETLYLGNTAPDNMGIYVRWSGSKNVYLMQLEDVNMFLIKKLQMFDKTVSEEFQDENNSIVSLSISGTGYEKPIKITAGKDAAMSSQYAMQSPAREVCGNTSVESVGESLYGITGNEVVAAQVSDEDIKKFGLDKPYMKITAKSADNSSVCLLASKEDSDGNCCIMKEGGNIICKTAIEDIKSWYNIKYTDFLAMTYIMPDMSKLSSLNINSYGKETDFELKHKTEINDLFEEVTTTTATLDGKEIEYTNLSRFVNNISNITRKDMDIKNLDGYEEIASFEFVFEGDNNVTDTLVIYKNSKSKYAVTLNGVIEGTTDGEYAESVLEQIDKISLDSELPVLNSDGESQNEENSDGQSQNEENTEEKSDE